ncbi:MAG TPA: hypothetical protein VFU47_05380 [Armatimonadota bacterium]|nr:hypothetical protein [Armatimonadota bacterium]
MLDEKDRRWLESRAGRRNRRMELFNALAAGFLAVLGAVQLLMALYFGQRLGYGTAEMLRNAFVEIPAAQSFPGVYVEMLQHLWLGAAYWLTAAWWLAQIQLGRMEHRRYQALLAVIEGANA